VPSQMRTPGVTDMAYPNRSPEDQSGLKTEAHEVNERGAGCGI